MRIAFLTPLFIPDTGGAEILLMRLVRSLADRGHEPVVLAPRRAGAAPDLPCAVVRIPRPRSKRFGQHLCLPHLLWTWRRRRFELLHCHGEYRAAVVGRTFQRLTGTPYVIRALGGGFDTADLQPRLRRRAERAIQEAAALIAQGRFLEQRILEHGGAPDRIRIIHNGVDFKELAADGPPPTTPPYIAYVGGFRRVKGYDVLLRAFARIRKEVAPVRLAIAGKPQEKDQFERLLKELDLGGAVEYVGVLDRSRIAAFYRHALLYVCPFRKAPFSNANLEAMACGLPVAATNVGGNMEQVRDGVEGLLVPPDDPAALAAAVRRLCLDASLRRRMGEAARRRAQEFDWEHMVDAYEELYRDVLDSAEAAR